MSQRVKLTASAAREAEWRERIARQAASGESVAMFCRGEAVSAWSFYRWRKLLEAGERVEPAGKAKSSAPFVDLGSLPAPRRVDAIGCARAAAGETVADLEIRIDLGGLVLTIARR